MPAQPFIALARIGHLDLLRQVFGAVVLTAVGASEIGIDATGEALAAPWLTISDVGAEVRFQPLNPGVDAGECSTISLALPWQANGERVLVIADDRCGRAEARSQGAAIIGNPAVLMLAEAREG